MGNNARAYGRRIREGFYRNYIFGKGLDIGCPTYKRAISPNVDLWDSKLGDGDATFLFGVKDNKYSFVLASHILEHLEDRETALKNWIRVLKPGGHLIITVPERDLFEEKRELPSEYNHDHKCYFKLDESEPPATVSFLDLLKTLSTETELIYAKVCDEFWPGQKNRKPHNNRKISPVGEFQIEAVLRKN